MTKACPFGKSHTYSHPIQARSLFSEHGAGKGDVQAEQYATTALTHLLSLPHCEARDILTDMTSSLVISDDVKGEIKK